MREGWREGERSYECELGLGLCASLYNSDTHVSISISPSFHLSFLQAQCSDFPQYEIIEQAPKGGDEKKMEEGTEGDAKEVRTEKRRGARS